MIKMRRATTDDLATITEIYNDAIQYTTATFDTQPKTVEEQRVWFEKHDSRHPIFVLEDGGDVFGWASLSEWSSRYAYSDTAEISLYIRRDRREEGYGKRLTEAMLREGKRLGIHAVIALIEKSNEASIHICEALGFHRVGVMREVGRKFDRLLDVQIMQILL